MAGPMSVAAGPDFRLAAVPMRRRLRKPDYKARLSRLRHDLRAVQLGVMRARLRGVVVLEGWDASGKGGAIRRMAAVLDPRACKVWPIGPPDARERGRHYLDRFWPRLPDPATVAVFDRSWYGRVLVERVEGLATPEEWERAYDEIRRFERMLTDDGVRLVKLFLHITPEEQLRRLRARCDNPLKRWKLSADDLRNRDLRPAYEAAVERMLDETATENAPWLVVPADDKRYARVAVLEAVVERLGAGLDRAPPDCDPQLAARLAAAD